MAIAARTAAISFLFALLVATAFPIHFAAGWTTVGRDNLELGLAVLSSPLIAVWPTSVPLSPALPLLHGASA